MAGSNNKITFDQFLQGLELLGEVYGNSHAVFTNLTVQDIWFRFFENYTITQFQRVVEYYIGHSQWFPKSPYEIQKLWEESGEQERLAQLELAKVPVLPPAQGEEFTPEQLIENRKKIALVQSLIPLSKGIKLPSLNGISVQELQVILEGAKKAHSAQKSVVVLQKNGQLSATDNALFQDIKAYFHSGSEKYRQMAIDWASDPTSGCELVYRNGQVVDIKEVEF